MELFALAPIIPGKLTLGAFKIEDVPQTVNVRQPLHQLFVIDKSGSMYGTLSALIEDLKKQCRTLHTGDYVSFAWFSSRGEFGFPIKAFQIIDESSFEKLDRLFDSHKKALNLTCFSEVLTEAEKVIDETSFLGTRFSLTFFSDGHANDRSSREERELSREIMRRLNGKFDFILTVAYSDYADHEFLTEMAQIAGGESVSSSSLADVSKIFSRFLRRAEFSAAKIRVSFGKFKPDFVFALDTSPETGGITLYTPDAETGDLYFAPSQLNKNNFLYFIARDQEVAVIPENSSRVWNLQNLLKSNSPGIENNHLISAAFASAIVLSQNKRRSEAIEVFGYLGDKYFVQKLGTAYTPTERAVAEDEIRSAIFIPSLRWYKGIDFDAVPARDAFCLLDLLQQLGSDESVRFHARHPEFKYRKIGRKTIQREGYPKFIEDADPTSPLSDLVWNENFLNLSIRVKIPGKVELPEFIRVNADGKLSASSEGTQILQRPDGLPEEIKTFQYKTYTLVKDGFLNVEALPVSCSISLAVDLIAKGIFMPLTQSPENTNNADGIIRLDKIPVINQKIAERSPSAAEMAQKVYFGETLKAKLKVFNVLRKELDPKQEKVSKTVWTEQQQKYLFALGFDYQGAYKPPRDEQEATDFYEATKFEFSIVGFSNLPTVSDVRLRLRGNKNLTTAAQPMAEALNEYESATAHFSVEEKIKWLDAKISEMKKLQVKNSTEIQMPKFALVLGHKDFSDITISDQETKFNIAAGDSEVTAKVKISKKEVYF